MAHFFPSRHNVDCRDVKNAKNAKNARYEKNAAVGMAVDCGFYLRKGKLGISSQIYNRTRFRIGICQLI
jgi:hypothetical protein